MRRQKCSSTHRGHRNRWSMPPCSGMSQSFHTATASGHRRSWSCQAGKCSVCSTGLGNSSVQKMYVFSLLCSLNSILSFRSKVRGETAVLHAVSSDSAWSGYNCKKHDLFLFRKFIQNEMEQLYRAETL